MIQFTSQTAMQAAGILYALSFLLSWSSLDRRVPLGSLCLATGLLCNLAALILRYHQAWPMLPMHLGAVALPFCLGVLVPVAGGSGHMASPAVRRLLLALMVLLTGAALLFPKDFYLPFLKSKTMLAHGFLWFGLAGRACFAASVAWAMFALLPTRRTSGSRPTQTIMMQQSHRWAALGFVLWTLSMFAGELWSYLGWGTPVVWEDPALTLTMAAWFFYACLLHLHLTRAWTLKARAGYASLGGLAILALTCLPDFGPYRSPF